MFERYKKIMDYCTACPRLCQSVCPVAMNNGNEAHSPWGLMQTLNLVRKGEIVLGEEAASLSYQCTDCRACTEQCEHSNDVPSVLNEARKITVKQELTPPKMSGFLDKFHRHNSPFSRDLLLKLKNILPSRYFKKESSVVYFPGCMTIAKTPDVIRDTFELFEKLKISFVGIYPETIQCCGYPLVSGGLEDDFVDLAEINFNLLKKYKTIISGCPSCVYTLRKTYSKYSFDLGKRVITINEFIDPYLHNINYRLKKGIRTKLMYHDPCYLSRYLKEIDLPRELISQVSGIEPVEFLRQREETDCCGQGGCYSISDKDNSNEIAKRRLEEVYEKNVQMLVTQCPSCIYAFRKNSKRLVVKDLISYLNDCIEGVKGRGK